MRQALLLREYKATQADRMSLRNVVLAASAALLYAGCYAAIKMGLKYAPPFRFAAMRALIGGAAILFILVATGRSLVPARRLWLTTAVLAVVGPATGFAAMFTSPLHTGAGLASIVGNMGPLLIIVLAAIFLGEPMTSGKIVACALSLAGLTLIALPRVASATSWHAPALALPLLAAMSGAGESVIVKRARLGVDVLAVAGWQFLLAAPVLFVLSQRIEPDRAILWTPSFVTLLVFLAAGATAGATALWYWLVQREEVSRLSQVLFLVPIAGLGLAAALFGERISPRQAAGVLLVLVGIGTAGFLRTRIKQDLDRLPATP